MQPEDKDQTPDVNSILRHLLDTGQLDGPAAGIARQVLARGESTLSERQEWVFDTHVRSRYLLRVCELCGDLIPLSDVMPSLGNGGLCSMCAQIMVRGTGTEARPRSRPVQQEVERPASPHMGAGAA